MKVLAYQVNREKGDMMIQILNLICTKAHAVQSLFCHMNGALQKKLLIKIVPKFIDCKPLFLKDGELLSTLAKDAFNREVIAHGTNWARILRSIQDFVEDNIPLPEYITKLNLNTANASMQYLHYRNEDGSYKKSEKKGFSFWNYMVYCGILYGCF